MKPYLQGIFTTILICLTSLILQGESREIPQEQDCEWIQDDGSNDSSQISINGTNSDRRKLCFKIGGLQVQVLHNPKIGDDVKEEGVWKLQLRHSNGKSTPQYRQHSQKIYSYCEAVPASVVSTYKYFGNIGFYKLYFDEATTWNRALEICAKDGAHLAVINSLSEAVRLRDILISFIIKGDSSSNNNNNRYNLKLKHFQAYIGIRYEDAANEFVTIFNEPLSATGFIAWGPDSPSDDVSSETGCVTLTKDGYTHNVNCSVSLPYFCEFEMVH